MTPAERGRGVVSVAGDREDGPQLTLPTPWVAQAGRDRVKVMTGLTTFLGRAYLCGPALTCACVPGDNLAMHAAVYQARPGTVVVCDGGGTTRTGLVGEFMATEAAGRGLGGIVISGPVRDRDDLDRLGFPVLCSGTAPAQSAKVSLLSVGEPVVVGTVLVRTGDQIVADRDGAVVVPAGIWPAVRTEAAALAGREDEVRRRLAAGERLADIQGLDLNPYLLG
jgi:4-hydroxy-4-methyl-2-oxoglutarate aldolase